MTRVTRRELWNSLSLYGDPQANDLGLKPPPAKRVQAHPERDTLNAIMALLRSHPKVAWRVRMNAGAYKQGTGPNERYISFGFVGCPDIWGQMKTGELLCIEVKSPVGQPTEAQSFFLERVRKAGGRAGVARSVEDALAIVEGR